MRQSQMSNKTATVFMMMIYTACLNNFHDPLKFVTWVHLTFAVIYFAGVAFVFFICEHYIITLQLVLYAN